MRLVPKIVWHYEAFTQSETQSNRAGITGVLMGVLAGHICRPGARDQTFVSSRLPWRPFAAFAALTSPWPTGKQSICACPSVQNLQFHLN